MTAYFITLFVAVFFAFLASQTEPEGITSQTKYSFPTKCFLVLSVATLVFTAGFRYFIGTDYRAYYEGLDLYGSNLKYSVTHLDEPGLPILATIVGWFTDDGIYFVFTCSLITVGLILYNTFKNSHNFVFCVLLFVLVGIWHESFNGVRQYLAAAIIFSGYKYIYDKKFLKYCGIVFLAFCVHRSAIIMIVPYFILRNRINFRNVLLLLVGTYIVSYSYESVFTFVGFLKETDIHMSDYAYYSNSVNTLRVLVFCAPAALALLLLRSNGRSRENDFYINLLLVNAAAMLATSNSAYLARLSIYTNVYTPIAMAKLLNHGNKVIAGIIKTTIIAAYFVYWYIDVTSSGALSPFKWVWER